jgi:hypothetical protein
MNRKLIMLLASICGVLLLVMAVEWLYALYAQHALLASTAAAAKQMPVDEMPRIELNKQGEESYDQLVARPLFIKGRKPVEEPKQEAQQAPVAPLVFDWELNGVYTKKDKLSALFSRTKTKVPKDNYRKVAVGGELDGWKLTEIRSDRAILMQGASKKEVLLHKAKPKTAQTKTSPAIPAPAVPPPIPAVPIEQPPEIAPEQEIIPPPEEIPEESFENMTNEE